MEPDQNDKNTPAQKSNDDLGAEGIEIVGSSMALDNEYSQPEVHNVRTDGLEEESAESPVKEDSPVAAPAETREVPVMPARPPEVPAPAAPKAPVAPPPPPTTISTPPTAINPVPAPNPIQNDPSIKPIRTFKSDAEEAVRRNNVSRVDIAVAEQKKKEKVAPTERVTDAKASPGLYIILVLLAIAILGGGWYYWFATSQKAASQGPAATVTIKTPIPYAKAGIVVIGKDPVASDPLALIGAKLKSNNPGLGNVYVIAPIESATSTAPVSTGALFGAAHVPARLLRSLSDDYMVGAYAYDVPGPFIIIRDTFYQNAFSGMLDWEKDMAADLLPLIRVAHESDTVAPSGVFEDSVISNIDVRALRDASGDVVLAYAFPDKDTIVIATSENTLKYVLDRLLQVRTIQ